MTADDTRREALIERVRELQRSVRELQAVRDTYREHWRRLMRDYEAVFKERDELEAENERLRETCVAYSKRDIAVTTERDAAIKRAEAAEARTVTAEQVEAAEAAIVEMLHDADEDSEGLDDLDLAQRAVAVTLNALGLRAGGEQARATSRRTPPMTADDARPGVASTIAAPRPVQDDATSTTHQEEP